MVMTSKIFQDGRKHLKTCRDCKRLFCIICGSYDYNMGKYRCQECVDKREKAER